MVMVYAVTVMVMEMGTHSILYPWRTLPGLAPPLDLVIIIIPGPKFYHLQGVNFFHFAVGGQTNYLTPYLGFLVHAPLDSELFVCIKKYKQVQSNKCR